MGRLQYSMTVALAEAVRLRKGKIGKSVMAEGPRLRSSRWWLQAGSFEDLSKL